MATVVMRFHPSAVGHRTEGRARPALRKPRSAFTLIELLVVVGIIALLAALLLPVLNRAQAKAQGVHCLSNVRQLQLAWQMYTDDHAGMVPENRAQLVQGIWRSSPNSWTGPSSAPFDADTWAIEHGSLFRGGVRSGARSISLSVGRLYRPPTRRHRDWSGPDPQLRDERQLRWSRGGNPDGVRP